MRHEIKIVMFGNDGTQVYCICQYGPKGQRPRKGQQPLAEVNNEEGVSRLLDVFNDHRSNQPARPGDEEQHR